MVQKWALLCGGNYYTGGTARPGLGRPGNLTGCVSDVEELEGLLIKFDVPQANIQKLTATTLPDEDKALEPKEQWPTWENIRRSLESIEEKAKQQSDTDNLLYFHYSGHGTLRRKDMPIYPDDSEVSDGKKDLHGTALVTTDVASGGPYLTGRQLGTWIKRMVEKSSFRATVVLDSCFSGDGLRRDDDGVLLIPRHLQKPDFSVIAADEEALRYDTKAINEAYRDAGSIHTSWLSNPKGCTVLTACARTETASERVFDNKAQGVLTHWMISTLSEFLGMKLPLPSHKRTLEHIRRWTRPKQMPMIYGDALFQFFGNHDYHGGESCNAKAIGTAPDLRIDLDIGRSQGVVAGATYKVFTQEGSNDGVITPSIQNPIHIEVTGVHAFRSTAKLVDASLASSWPQGEIRLASLHQWVLPTTVYIRFQAGETYRTQFSNCLPSFPGLKIIQDESKSPNFVITLNDPEDTFRVSQNSVPLPRLPRISSTDTEWPVKLARVLSHVSRFQALWSQYDSVNSAKLPKKSFEIVADPVKVHADKDLTLTLRYFGSNSSLWISLYCFSASWGIAKLWPKSGIGAEKVDTSDPEVFENLITMTLPPKIHESDPSEIEDRFVFFVSTSPDGQIPSWGDIQLHRLENSLSSQQMEWSGRLEEEGDVRDVLEMRSKPKELKPEWITLTTTVKTIERSTP